MDCIIDFNTKQLEKMCKLIDSFSKNEHIKILEIIRKKEADCISENNNGTFIHMEDLSYETLNEIENYIQYIIKKEGDITSIEHTKDILKSNINKLTE